VGRGSDRRRAPFEGLYDRLPLAVPSAACPHRAASSKQQARAKRRRVARRAGEPSPCPPCRSGHAAQECPAHSAGPPAPQANKRHAHRGETNDGSSLELTFRAARDATRRKAV
jgi:hypothetical protein